ncbi:MAG TPA: bifunctional folylpolyglutamate synthase/dihydrofolate synthase [Dehalococcoidia bacterium]|nr:bifunctional folylpolyglutamate synthase/dihydrofolate synthase [Dehalococcoidia bacterium]
MNYQEALDYILSYPDYEKVPMPHEAANYDLRRVDELLARLGNPHLKARSVHITGTNGKGSTAAIVASALTAAGYTTGLYTSPHLNDLRERMRVGTELISEEEYVALVERLKPEAQAVNQKATYGELTTFELLTTLAFNHFNLKRVDFQVLEVGMGGKFDATNVINPEVCIITSISLDHTEVLGNSLAEIAAEKAGIIKSGSVVVTSPQPDEVAQVIDETCQKCGAELIRVGSDITWHCRGFDLNRQLFQVRGILGNYELSIPLLGYHQLDNAATAVAALEVLTRNGCNISKDSITDGLAQVSWPGRFQIISHHPLLVVDGAMNVEGVRRLKQSLVQYFGSLIRLERQSSVNNNDSQAILVIGASLDKDIAGIVSELVPLFDKVIVTHSRHPRAMAPVSIVAEFTKYGVKPKVVDDVAQALSLALTLAGERDIICVTGSLFVVGEAIEQANRLCLTDGNRVGK